MRGNEKKKQSKFTFFMFLFFVVRPAYPCDCVCARVCGLCISAFAIISVPSFNARERMKKDMTNDNEICTNHISKARKFVFGLSVMSFPDFSSSFSFCCGRSIFCVFKNCLRKCMRKGDVCVYFVDAITFPFVFIYFSAIVIRQSNKPIRN